MRLFAALGLLVVVVPAALAATAQSVRAPGPVSALAMDGRAIAFASGRSAGNCDRVRIWSLQTRGVTTLGRSTSCEVASTGTGIAALSLAGSRVLWLHYTGGNIREWSLYTATPTRRTPRRLAFVARDVDSTAPIVVGPGDSSRFGDILPYAIDRVVVALGADGGRRFAWTAPAQVTALAAFGGELAVASEGGLVTILDASGGVIGTETYSEDAQVVRITGAGLLLQRGRTLELRGSGAPRTWLLPVRATLHDATADAAYYVTSGQIRELRLDAANRQRQLGLGSHVQTDGSTLAFSTGRRVTAGPRG
jgi:hypothetical protein